LRSQILWSVQNINYISVFIFYFCLPPINFQEEESRRDENLKYNCKCSFLEIYNEQITDLLDPSSTNLLVSSLLRSSDDCQSMFNYFSLLLILDSCGRMSKRVFMLKIFLSLKLKVWATL
jgi:hypothetical protein